MSVAAWLRKLTLVTHLTVSLGWIGAVMVYVALGIWAVRAPDVETVRSAWAAMELTGWYVIVPLAVAALVTGVVISLGTPWGLFRHYWVLFSLGLTAFSTVILVLHMPSVSAGAAMARTMDSSHLSGMGGDLFHPSVGLVVLLIVAVLNVYKPRGLTPYGWRKAEQRRRATSLVGTVPEQAS